MTTSAVGVPGPKAAAGPDTGPSDRPALAGVQLLEELGRGSHTVVYRARRNGALFAVKVLVDTGDGQSAAEFRREAALLACVEHPGLVRVHEVGESGGRSYLIMDLIDGRSLAAVLSDGRLDEPATVALGLALSAALVPAHRAGVVHRDIKPPNVMISGDGRPHLIDFGLAARSGGQAGDVAVGTFAYSAPEQTGMLHRAVDGRADLYSLGVVLYECVTGAPPFAADDAAELARLHLSATPVPVSQRRPGTSPAFAAMVSKLLAKDPDDRYQSAEGLRADLERLTAGTLEVAALGAGDDAGRGSELELVGRTTECAALRSRWERARAGAGGVALVQGGPGSGKSRLVRELTADVSGAGFLVLSGRCVPDSGVPLAAVRSVVERHLADINRLPDPARGVAVDRLRLAAGGTAAVLAAMSPALGALLGAPELAAGDYERQLDEAIAALLVGMARAAGGAILHLDDVQWCDDRSRWVLRRLVRQLADTPLLVVATARDEAECHEQLESFAADIPTALDPRLTLRPLSESEMAALVAAQLGSAPIELMSRVIARSAGNPLAVLEYVRAVVDAGLLRPYWGRWQLDHVGLEALALPDSVVDLVLRRIDALGTIAHEVLVVAAAVGTRFTGDLVGAVVGFTADAVQRVLTEAAGHRLVEAATGGGHRFLHDRIRETLLADLDAAARRRLHHRIATELDRAGPEDAEPDHAYEVARHYLLGDTGEDPERVFTAVVAAGRLALHQHAPAEAVRLLTNAAAIAVSAGLTTDAALHADLGLAATRLDDQATALRHLTIALAAEHDPLRRARLCELLAGAHMLRHDAEPAIEIVRRGFTELGYPLPRNPFRLFVSTVALLLWGVFLSWLPARWRVAGPDRAPTCRLHLALVVVGCEAAIVAQRTSLLAAIMLSSQPMAQRLRPANEYAHNQVGLAFLIGVAGFPRRSERMIARALALAESTGDLRLIARLHYYRSITRDGFPPLTADTGKDLLVTLSTHGRWLDFGFYLTLVALLEQTWLARGHTVEAAESHRGTLAQTPGDDNVLGHMFGIAGVELAALSGRPAQAARQLTDIRALLDTRPAYPMIHAKVAIAAIRLAVEQGELGAPFDDAYAAFDALGLKPTRVWAVDRMCWAYRAFGRLAQAAGLPADQRAERLAAATTAVAELRRAVNGPVLRAYHDVARCALAQLRGDNGTAVRRLAALAVKADDLDLPLLHYEVARTRARAYRDTGRLTDARWHARIAQLIAVDRGWPTRARWVRTEFSLDAPPGGTVTPGTATGRPGVAGLPDRSLTSRGLGSGIEQRRLQALQQVALAAASVLDPVEVARLALDEIVTIFGAERAFLFVREAGDGAAGLELVPYIGRTEARIDLTELTGYGSRLVDRVAASGAPLVVAGSEEGAALGSQSTVVHGLRSIMVAPLLLSGRLLGVIYLDSRAAKGVFTHDDVDVLVAITNHIATALETARAAQLELGIHAARRERDLAQLLHQAMTDLGGSLDPDEVATRLIATMSGALPIDSAVLLRRIDDTFAVAATTGSAAAVTGVDPAYTAWLNAGIGRTRSGPAGRQPPPDVVAGLLGCAPRGWLVVPLVTRGEERGVLVAGTLTGSVYTEAEIEIATALAGQGAVALENAVLYRQVENLAIRDGLSGLFNRRHFFELAEQRLATSRRYQRPLAAIMADIDHFKSVNDTYGHSVGDEVICEIAHRLAGVLRDSDIICRYGGEEFAVLMSETSTEQGIVVADRLCATVNGTPVQTAAGPLTVTISVGLAVPNGDNDVHALLKLADEALYVAKRGGRNQVAVALI